MTQISRVLVLGATSDIARATARAVAANGADLILAGRDPDALARERADLATRYGVGVEVMVYDTLDWQGFQSQWAALDPLPDLTICAVGLLGDQPAAQADPTLATRILRSNFEGPAVTLGLVAQDYEARRAGTIVAISSVAGDRGRASNYVYGAAKAGLTAFLSGLRNRLHGTGVRVITVLPGFVATRMTDGMELPGALTAQPEAVAKAILGAVAGRRDVVYVKPVWWAIMAVIRHLPEAVFKRTRL